MSTLYLIPVTLGDESDPGKILPVSTLEILRRVKTFFVEDEKSARRFLKLAGTTIPMPELQLHPIGKHVTEEELRSYKNALQHGGEMGLLSEAGCPGVADPGAEIVRMAHEAGTQVVPLVGPSSLLLALMASGMNGQQFHFHGYLPIGKSERAHYLRRLQKGTTHLFIETPFRNNQLLEDLLKTLDNSTRLCVACDVTLPGEFIRTATISEWKKIQAPDLHKRPAVFLVG